MLRFRAMNEIQGPPPPAIPPLKKEKSENALLNLLFNIAIPVYILNKGTAKFGPEKALLIALAFPLVYGAYDYYRQRKVNYIALLGLLNVGFTGGFALSGLTGIWFAVKEASFPLLIGVFVFASRYSESPFVKKIFLNPQVMNVDLIEERLKERGRVEFEELLRTATLFFAGSFLISALLNFGLAYTIFTEFAPEVDAATKSGQLNEQIAQMTQWSFVVIMLPSMLILAGILWYLIRGLERTTGLAKEQIFKTS